MSWYPLIVLLLLLLLWLILVESQLVDLVVFFIFLDNNSTCSYNLLDSLSHQHYAGEVLS
jgi:hypothetical protein